MVEGQQIINNNNNNRNKKNKILFTKVEQFRENIPKKHCSVRSHPEKVIKYNKKENRFLSLFLSYIYV